MRIPEKQRRTAISVRSKSGPGPSIFTQTCQVWSIVSNVSYWFNVKQGLENIHKIVTFQNLYQTSKSEVIFLSNFVKLKPAKLQLWLPMPGSLCTERPPQDQRMHTAVQPSIGGFLKFYGFFEDDVIVQWCHFEHNFISTKNFQNLVLVIFKTLLKCYAGPASASYDQKFSWCEI